MFKLIAFMFMVVNGVPAGEPTITLTSKQQFDSTESCMNYFNTPEGIAAKAVLMSIVSAQNERYEIRATCEKVGEAI